MPIKFLQFLRQDIKPGSAEEQPENSTLYSEEPTSSLPKLLKSLIAALCITYFLLVLMGFFTDKVISNLINAQRGLIVRLTPLLDDERQIVIAERKIEYYKNSLQGRSILSGKANFVFGKIGVNLQILEAKVSTNSFEVRLKGSDAYTFTKLISDYLGGNYVSEISLKSADFNPQDKIYTVVLGGSFK